MGLLALKKTQQLAAVDELMGSTDWASAKLKLFKGDMTPNENTALGDLEEADFDGYAAATLTWSDAFLDQSGQAVSSAGEKLFTKSGADGGLAYGAYITNAAGTILLAAARLDEAPFTFTNDGDTLPLTTKVGVRTGWIATEDVP